MAAPVAFDSAPVSAPAPRMALFEMKQEQATSTSLAGWSSQLQDGVIVIDDSEAEAETDTGSVNGNRGSTANLARVPAGLPAATGASKEKFGIGDRQPVTLGGRRNSIARDDSPFSRSKLPFSTKAATSTSSAAREATHPRMATSSTTTMYEFTDWSAQPRPDSNSHAASSSLAVSLGPSQPSQLPSPCAPPIGYHPAPTSRRFPATTLPVLPSRAALPSMPPSLVTSSPVGPSSNTPAFPLPQPHNETIPSVPDLVEARPGSGTDVSGTRTPTEPGRRFVGVKIPTRDELRTSLANRPIDHVGASRSSLGGSSHEQDKGKGKAKEVVDVSSGDESDVVVSSAPLGHGTSRLPTTRRAVDNRRATSSSSSESSDSSDRSSSLSTLEKVDAMDLDDDEDGDSDYVEQALLPARKRRKKGISPELREPYGDADFVLDDDDAGSDPGTLVVAEKVKRPGKPRRALATAPPAGKRSTTGVTWENAIILDLRYVLQTVTCVAGLTTKKPDSSRHPIYLAMAASPCRPCRRRLPGFVCSFKDFRCFRIKDDRTLDYESCFVPTGEDDVPVFPTDFDVPFTPVEADLLKTVAADKLIPTMRREFAHAERASRVRRELSTINTCETCLHVILSGSWICKLCGKDICLDCHDLIAASDGPEGPTGRSALLEATAPSTIKKTLDCRAVAGSAKIHHATDFCALTRMDASELERTVAKMEAWKKDHPVRPPKELPPGWLDQFLVQPDEAENSLPYLRFPSSFLPPDADDSPLAPDQDVAPAPVEGIAVETSDDFAELDEVCQGPAPGRARRLPDGLSTLDFFRSVWARGEAMVVDIDLSEVSQVPWNPQHFIDQFGDEGCTVASNKPGSGEKRRTVGEFFREFGTSGTSFDKSRKIKDWPPSNDFRNAYPALWQDFMSMIPVGSVTRRDGVLNISTHTPQNANPPDLGPKGYFSEISDDREGGQGSTKLHTVNVLLWSSNGPQAKPGVAVWDLYRAEDADKIREFLYEYIAELGGYSDIEQVKATQDDPIHTQRFFLDQKLRQRLWEKKGVKSWRVHQEPGQVVFIPAGCAHQVCNFADCIKVASDFVSIENVGRCWQVTDEFRKQTREEKLWRSDVLQLKSQLLWAWRSAERFDPPEEADSTDAGPSSKSVPS
ncbi:hypothetical protein JCM10212_000610 [Sporobolomyces blumeae]